MKRSRYNVKWLNGHGRALTSASRAEERRRKQDCLSSYDRTAEPQRRQRGDGGGETHRPSIDVPGVLFHRQSLRALGPHNLIAAEHHTLAGGGGAQFVDGRSRMKMDPRIPTMPGRSMSGFHQPGRRCSQQTRSTVRCSASRMKGELHSSKNRS